MKKILFYEIHPALAIITLLSIALLPATVIMALTYTAVQPAQALTTNFGGKITLIKTCVLDTPAIDPVTCAISCPLCTGLLQTRCAGHQEIIFTPAPGGSGWNFICPTVGALYKGGGYPRIGGFIIGNSSSPSRDFFYNLGAGR